MSHAPFLNNYSLISAESLDAAKEAAMLAKQGAELTHLALTAKEKGLTAAMSLRFVLSNNSPGNQKMGYEAYRDSLKALHAVMPDDIGFNFDSTL